MAQAHNEFDDFFDGDDGTPIVDTRADGRLYRVPLGRLAPNLVNPRTDFGTEDQLIDLGKSLARRQIQACPVVSRNAYLKLWPDHAEKIGDVDYVLVSGERRFHAATAVGLPALTCVADDNVAADRKTFMEAVVSENVDRQNFDPIEEAYAVQALVAEFGSNRAVAQHFERVDGWVTQRVLLTNLAREVQDLVRKKEIPLEAARSLGKQARDNAWGAAEQLAWWQDEQERRAAAAAARSAARKAAKQASPASSPQPAAAPPAPPSFTAVNPEQLTEPIQEAPEASSHVRAPVPGQAEEPPARKPVANGAAHQSVARPEVIPEPRATGSAADSEDAGEAKRFPYRDGREAGNLLLFKMPPEERDVVFDMLLRDREKRAAQAT
ncbi:ParB/RepB/Spo0J family partition protein [Streptomyces sp. MB22_4]|uniref:ParB/RepB/Spo0J family partition protein n=1 Tax=Streptomyces sp. MB22_4 TaxID=3383120 RepID=UPI0039A04856